MNRMGQKGLMLGAVSHSRICTLLDSKLGEGQDTFPPKSSCAVVGGDGSASHIKTKAEAG